MYSGVVVTGAQTVYDRHNLKKKLSDNYTTMQAYRAIYLNTDKYQDSNISIATFNDSILITGQTPFSNHKKEIENLIRPFSGERTIYNHTEIINPVSFLTKERCWIVKSKRAASNDLDLLK